MENIISDDKLVFIANNFEVQDNSGGDKGNEVEPPPPPPQEAIEDLSIKE